MVTHPEELRTRKDDGGVTDPLRFRVYAYTDHPMYYSGPDRMSEPMVMDVMGVDLIDHSDPDQDRLVNTADLRCLAGGVTVDGDDSYSGWQAATHADDASSPSEEMSTSRVRAVGPIPRVYLYNTPFTCRSLRQGLASTERAQLYMMEYVPSPVLGRGVPDFSRDLSTVDTVGLKNTARWTLALDPALLTVAASSKRAGRRITRPATC